MVDEQPEEMDRTILLMQLLVLGAVVTSVVFVLRSELTASVQFASFAVLFVLVVVLTWPFTDPVAE